MKDKLSQVSSDFSLVLNDSGADVFKSARNIVKNLSIHEEYTMKFIACILHDKDRDEEKNLKTRHYHLVLRLENRYRVQSVLNYIVDIFHCNVNQVSIEKCIDIGAQCRYLIHLDHRDKYQYDYMDIVSTNYDTLDYYFSHIRVIDERDVLDLIDKFPSRKELFKRLGAKQYREWRFIINDLLR